MLVDIINDYEEYKLKLLKKPFSKIMKDFGI